MKSTNWKDVAELIGITAIVLSLLFVGLQLRQSQQLAVEELVSYSNERQNAIRGLIVANAEIWQKACSGEPLDPASRIIAAKIYDAWTDHMIAEIILRRDGVNRSDTSQQRSIEVFAAQHWIYPGLWELSNSRREWHGGAVETTSNGGEIRSRLFAWREKLESSNVSQEGDPAWCGRT